jgi:hypothetical protein
VSKERFETLTLPISACHNGGLLWLRRNDPTLFDVNDATISSLAKVCGVPTALPHVSDLKTKAKTVEDTFLLARNSSLRPEKLDDASVQAFCECSRIPIPKGLLSPSAKKALVNDLVSWLRKNGRRLPPIEDPNALKGMANLAGTPFPRKVLSMQEKKIAHSVFTCLRKQHPQ